MTTQDIQWPGARWWKFEIHTHTPASNDYGKGPEQGKLKDCSPESWLLDYMRQGFDAVVVTDHNSGEWIDHLKTALEALRDQDHSEFRELVLFPGVELSVHGGVHLLAILDPAKGTSDINQLLGAVGFTGDPGNPEELTKETLPVAVEVICRDLKGIAVPAHVDECRGIFKESKGQTLRQTLESPYLFAMELRDTEAPKPQLYQDHKLQWTEILGSDAHHPQGDTQNSGQSRFPGSHYTWIKMGAPSLEGLRLALQDGAASVRRSDKILRDPNLEHGGPWIRKITIKNTKHLGRDQPFEVKLNPWLNAVVGGRGTGKSSLVEFLRLALGRSDELPEKMQPEFEKYQHVGNRHDGALLLPETRIEVLYEKEGACYRALWQTDAAAPSLETLEDGEWHKESGNIDERLPVRIYSQKQIFEMSKEPRALLRVVDDAADVDRRSWDLQWKEAETRYLTLCAQAREIQSSLEAEPSLQGELQDVRRKMTVFEEAGHAQVLRSYQQRASETRRIESWEKTWRDTGDHIRKLAEDMLPDPLAFAESTSEGQELLERAEGRVLELESLQTELHRLAARADEILESWHKDRESSDWSVAAKEAQSAYNDLVHRLEDEQAGAPSQYAELVQRRQELETRLRDLVSRREQLHMLKVDTGRSFQKLEELRKELTRKRGAFLERVLSDHPHVRIEIEPYGDRDRAALELRELLNISGERFGKDLGSDVGDGLLLDNLYRSERSECQTFERDLRSLKSELKALIQGKDSSYQARDKRFIDHLARQQEESVDRLMTWFPEDVLKISYSPDLSGRRWKSLQHGSPGQRTAALLAFLLSYGDEPLVLDQPEDDLDNLLIYDVIVRQLQSTKSGRQVLMVTHNPNLVVHGDAELTLAFEAGAGRTHISAQGSLQELEVREKICEVMEGGREAFERRYKRIVLET